MELFIKQGSKRYHNNVFNKHQGIMILSFKEDSTLNCFSFEREEPFKKSLILANDRVEFFPKIDSFVYLANVRLNVYMEYNNNAINTERG